MSDFRASDADRDRAAQDIREHFAAGRLTEEEMDERVEAVYASRTDGELRRLLADLPRLPVTRAQQRAEIAERRRHLQRRLLQQTGGGLALLVRVRRDLGWRTAATPRPVLADLGPARRGRAAAPQRVAAVRTGARFRARGGGAGAPRAPGRRDVTTIATTDRARVSSASRTGPGPA